MITEFLNAYWLEILFALVVLTTLGFWIASYVVRYKDDKQQKSLSYQYEPIMYHSPRERE